MEDIQEVKFRVRKEDVVRWEQILAGLEEGEAGALFQERMAEFGEAVDERLEALIDEEEGFGPDAFNLSGWRREGEVFWLEFECPDMNFAESLRELFSLCPVPELEVSVDWE